MDAKIGDRLVIDAVRVGQTARHGEVLEVMPGAPHAHYRVRWDDGHESTFFPGAETHLELKTPKRR